jgi:hypothetical protein
MDFEALMEGRLAQRLVEAFRQVNRRMDDTRPRFAPSSLPRRFLWRPRFLPFAMTIAPAGLSAPLRALLARQSAECHGAAELEFFTTFAS